MPTAEPPSEPQDCEAHRGTWCQTRHPPESAPTAAPCGAQAARPSAPRVASLRLSASCRAPAARRSLRRRRCLPRRRPPLRRRVRDRHRRAAPNAPGRDCLARRCSPARRSLREVPPAGCSCRRGGCGAKRGDPERAPRLDCAGAQRRCARRPHRALRHVRDIGSAEALHTVWLWLNADGGTAHSAVVAQCHPNHRPVAARYVRLSVVRRHECRQHSAPNSMRPAMVPRPWGLALRPPAGVGSSSTC